MKAAIWLETSSPNTHKLFKSKESLKRWKGAASRGWTVARTARPPRPPRPAPPKRIRAASCAHRPLGRSGSEPGPLPTPTGKRAPPPRNGPRAQVPHPSSARTPGPAQPGHLRDGRRERLLRGWADQQRLEKCQSQGQQAASSHLRDRGSIPPRAPAGGRNSAGTRGRRSGTGLCAGRRCDVRRLARRGPGADPLGDWGANRGAGQGRRRADPLARGGRSAPRLPRLRRHQQRLCKQTWASLPALSLSLSFSPRFLPWFIPLIAEEKEEEAAAGAEEGWRRSGGGGVGGGMGEWQAQRLVAERGSVWLLPASQREVAGGGQREGWASEQSGGDWPGGALHTRQRGTPKVGVGLLPPPGVRRGSGPGPAGLPGDSRPPSGHPQVSEVPAENLACVFAGYFCTCRQRSPSPSPRRRVHCLPGIVAKWFDNKCGWGLYLRFKAPLLTLYQVALFVCPTVPEARASGTAECQLYQPPQVQVRLTWRGQSLRARTEDGQRRTWCYKVLAVLPFGRTEG